MSKYKGLFTFDEDSHKYIPIPIAGADGIIDTIGHEPAEPLIKDEKIRKAVRAWAEINQFGAEYVVKYCMNNFSLTSWQANIEFNSHIKDLEDGKEYTITELCGEDEK